MYRRKASSYKKSKEWKKHPLNIHEKLINFDEVDRKLAELKECPIIDFSISGSEFSEFKKKTNGKEILTRN